MKITKYPQSCLYIETNDKEILVGPGNLKYEERFIETWKKADCILITHKHGDHIYSDVLKNLNIPIYSTEEVQKAYPELNIHIVKEGDAISLGTIKIELVHAVHGYNPNLKGEKTVLENVGYIIDDGNKRFYTTSDTICFENDYKADCCPSCNSTWSYFANALDATLVLPIHMDNPTYPTDIEYMKKNFLRFNTNYKVLDIEESVEI